MADAHERGEPLNHQAAEWSIGTLAIYGEALRKAEKEFSDERDRRYTRENELREQALKIKEEADKVALSLARENQKLKEDHHNEVLNAWQNERGEYATRREAAAIVEKLEGLIKPLYEFINKEGGGKEREQEISQSHLDKGLLLAGLFGGTLAAILTHVIK